MRSIDLKEVMLEYFETASRTLVDAVTSRNEIYRPKRGYVGVF
jgi:hypothetical protein